MKELDLSALFKVIKQNILIILLSGAVLAGAVFCYNHFFVAPTYRTTTTILVNNGGLADVGVPGDSVNGSDLNASLYLVETCVDILESDYMFKELANALGGDYSSHSLKSRFSPVARGEESLLIDISTYGTDPEEIKEIANTFLEVAPTFIQNNILSVDVKVLADAVTISKVGPRTSSNTLVAFIVGVFACVVIFVLISLLKNTIESESDFKATYDVPLLGTVPVFENKQSKGNRNEKVK
ncbi:MAG: hypothetical protein J6Q74_01675 [Clostridia bacterium]|nr:hypothetical protein [Clostridia bacterium]